MLVHRRSSPRNLLGFPNNLPVPIYTPGWREALWELSVLPKNKTQHNVPGQGSNPAIRSGDERTNHEATAPPDDQRNNSNITNSLEFRYNGLNFSSDGAIFYIQL